MVRVRCLLLSATGLAAVPTSLALLPPPFLPHTGAHSVRSSVRVSNDFSRIASWRGGAAANSDSKPPLMSTQLGLVRVAGYGIIAGSLCLKTPQIARVWHAKSLVGLAPASIYADVFLFATSVVYHVLKRNPIRAYGESIIVLLQTMVMVGLLWRFGTDENVDAASSSYSSSSSPIAAGAAGAGAVVVDGKADPAANKKKVRGGGLVGKVTIVVGSVAASLLCWQYLPEPMWGLLVIVSTPAILAVQLPQIWKNWRQKHTGELATLTVFLAFLGSTVRIGTTIADLGGDPWLLLNYVLGASSNAVMLTQVYVYRARTAVVREIVDAKAHPAAAAA